MHCRTPVRCQQYCNFVLLARIDSASGCQSMIHIISFVHIHDPWKNIIELIFEVQMHCRKLERCKSSMILNCYPNYILLCVQINYFYPLFCTFTYQIGNISKWNLSMITVFILFNVYTDILKILLNVYDNDMYIDFQLFRCGFHSN